MLTPFIIIGQPPSAYTLRVAEDHSHRVDADFPGTLWMAPHAMFVVSFVHRLMFVCISSLDRA